MVLKLPGGACFNNTMKPLPSLRAVRLAAAGLALACGAHLAAAQDDTPPKLTPLPEAPEPPPRVKSGEVMEPDVRIFRRAKERVNEYRVNGKVHAVRIEPEYGAAYYLIDKDGDGKLDSRRYGADFLPAMWQVFSW